MSLRRRCVVNVNLATVLIGRGGQLRRVVAVFGSPHAWRMEKTRGRDCRAGRQHRCNLQALSHIRVYFPFTETSLEGALGANFTLATSYPEPDRES